MSKVLYRINDIVITRKQYNPTVYYYCRILGIVDNDDIIHSEYNIVTGRGDKNSKVKVILERFAEEDSLLNITESINREVYRVDPHDVFLRNPYKMIEETNRKIEVLNNRIDFFNKNKNPIDLRDEKISKLIK